VRVRAVARGDTVARVPIDHRTGAVLPLVAARTIHQVKLPKERFQYRTIGVPKSVAGPIHYGERIGTLEVLRHGRPVARVPLTAALEVPKASAARKAQDFLTTPWTLVVLGALMLLAALLSARRGPRNHDDRPRRGAEEAPAP
jgi:hypothetical protein